MTRRHGDRGTFGLAAGADAAYYSNMRSMIVGAGRPAGEPLLTSLGVTRRRLRQVPLPAPDDPEPRPDRTERPSDRGRDRPTADPAAADRAAPGRGGLPAAVRFDFGWVDPACAPSMHSMIVRPMTAADVDALAMTFAPGLGGPSSWSGSRHRPGSKPWPGSQSGSGSTRWTGSTGGSPAEREPFTRRFRQHLSGQATGDDLVLVAESDATVCGYLCVAWRSGYPPFRAADIPEIVDLQVLPPHRRRGVATILLEVAESTVATRSTVVGLGVGLHGGFGAAQRLAVKRGFLPDGRGLSYAGRPVAADATVRVDDAARLMFTKRVR